MLSICLCVGSLVALSVCLFSLSLSLSVGVQVVVWSLATQAPLLSLPMADRVHALEACPGDPNVVLVAQSSRNHQLALLDIRAARTVTTFGWEEVCACAAPLCLPWLPVPLCPCALVPVPLCHCTSASTYAWALADAKACACAG
jgi:hypothetical protein